MNDSAPPPALRSNRQRFFDFLLILATLFPLVTASVYGSALLARWGCPSGTFLSGTMTPNLRFAGVMLFALGGGYLLCRLLFRLFPALPKLTGHPARYGRPARAGGWPRFWLYFAAVWTLAGALALVGASLAAFCLAPQAITYSEDPGSGAQTYAWRSVTAIVTSCSRGARGSWNAVYLLVLRDGTAIDLVASEPRFRDGYPALVRALRGRDIGFDARRVAADCGHGEADILRHPPR